MQFNELGICPQILGALTAQGYEIPSPIQEQAIPAILSKRDVLGCAQTGSGKTAAFAVPILQLLWERNSENNQNKKIRALILTPTRELAIQIYENFRAYGKMLPLRCGVIVGGANQNPQVAMLKKGADILIATPGRLNDLMEQGYVDLSHVEIFVLDEADRMLDMGFIHDVKKIAAKMPENKQTLLFSATLSKEILALIDTMLHDYIKVMIHPESPTVEAIEQYLYYVDTANKSKLLYELLADLKIGNALVFTRTKHGADRLVKYLVKAGIPSQAIHGNKSQNTRQAALKDFKSGRIRILVATDIAARGIDIEGLPYVFNFDIPEESEMYVHRIGRTGRAGKSGIAISFSNYEERRLVRDIEKLILKSIPIVEEHVYPMIDKTIREKKVNHRPPRPKAPLKKQNKPANSAMPYKKRNPKTKDR